MAQETLTVKFSVPLSWFSADTIRGYDITGREAKAFFDGETQAGWL